MKKTSEIFAEYAGVALAVFIIVLIVLFSSCGMKWKQSKCRQWGVCQTVKDSTYIYIKDSAYINNVEYVIKKDSASVKMLLKCDSMGNVYLINSEYWQGRYLQIKSLLNNNSLQVTAIEPERNDSVPVINTSHSELNHAVKVEKEYVNVLTKWQKFQISCFWLLIIVSLLSLLYFAYRLVKWIRK